MLEMIMLSAAGVWFAVFILVALASLIWANENDSLFLGLGILALSWACLEFLFGVPVAASIVTNPLILVMYFGLYVAGGALYAGMWKLPNFVKKNSARIRSDFKDWESRQAGKDTGSSYEAFLNSGHYRHSVSNNKEKVLSWVVLWPAGLLWELMHKPFIWTWNALYRVLGNAFDSINKRAARKVLDDNKR